jgi:PAS domain S-box-containing protein
MEWTIMAKDQLDILLVDDNEQEFAHLQGLLSQIKGWHWKLDQAVDYATAWEKIQAGQPDICLLNPRLAKLSNGQNHLQQIMAQPRATALILLINGESGEELSFEAEAPPIVDRLNMANLDPARLERSLRQAARYREISQTLEKRFEAQLSQLTADSVQLRKELMQWKHEAAVRQEQQGLYQDLFNVDVYGVEVLDGQGIITDANVTYQAMLGFSRDEMVGRPTVAFASERDKVRLSEKFLETKSQGYAEGEIELVCKDGSIILVWRRWRATYNQDKQFSGAVAYSRDITERMSAVRQISTLARALEQSPKAVLIADSEGLIEYINFRFTEVTGYSYDEAVGQTLRQVKANLQPPEMFQEIWTAISEGDEWDGEYYNRRQDGEGYWEELFIAPMFTPQNTISHFVAIQDDITARKVLEDETLHSQQRVGQLMTTQIGDLQTNNERLQQEIAKRERVESELRRSRARLKAQYKGIPVPTYSWQISGKELVLVDYNDVAEKESGGRIVDFLGKTATEIFQNDPQVMSDFARCVQQKTTVRREAPYKLVTTGEVKYFVTTYNFVPPHLVVVHIQDISEHKKIEEELAAYKKKEGKGAAEAGELTRLQESYQQELVRRQAVEAELEQIRRQLEAAPAIAEFEKLQKSLRQAEANYAATAQALQESEARFQQIAGNIDERLREQYRSIPIPTYTWQRIQDEFILIDFNDAAAKNMGKIVDFFGKAAGDIFKDRPEILADFERCYEEKSQVVREAPYTMITTGETRFFVTTYNFVPPNLVVDHIQDITEQKQIEAELAEAHRQLAALTGQESGAAALQAQLAQAIAQREQAEQALATLQRQMANQHDQLEELVKTRTAELTEVNKQLQREIFEHQRAEESLREARTRLKIQYKGLPIPTYSWRRVANDFVLVDYNYAAEKSSQGQIAQFMSKKASDIFKDRAQVLADLARCYDTKSTVRQEAPYRLITTGEIRHFITTYNFAPPNLVIVYIQDVTETKKLAEAVAESVEQVELGCRFSPDGRLTFVNDAYCWYFNEPVEALLGHRMAFVLDRDQAKFKAHFAGLDQDQPVASLDFRVQKSDGAIRWQRWISRAIFDKHGQLVEYRCTGRDITRRKSGEGKV